VDKRRPARDALQRGSRGLHPTSTDNEVDGIQAGTLELHSLSDRLPDKRRDGCGQRGPDQGCLFISYRREDTALRARLNQYKLRERIPGQALLHCAIGPYDCLHSSTQPRQSIGMIGLFEAF